LGSNPKTLTCFLDSFLDRWFLSVHRKWRLNENAQRGLLLALASHHALAGTIIFVNASGASLGLVHIVLVSILHSIGIRWPNRHWKSNCKNGRELNWIELNWIELNWIQWKQRHPILIENNIRSVGFFNTRHKQYNANAPTSNRPYNWDSTKYANTIAYTIAIRQATCDFL
jgi:hypothetical protein